MNEPLLTSFPGWAKKLETLPPVNVANICTGVAIMRNNNVKPTDFEGTYPLKMTRRIFDLLRSDPEFVARTSSLSGLNLDGPGPFFIGILGVTIRIVG